jgi:type VI secretion system protein ImpJ
MTWNNKVVWNEGMFLSPQHFQQFGRFLESQIDGRIDGIQCHDWGISELRIDEGLLPLGKISIATVKGRLRDGLGFNIPQDEEAPDPLEIPENTQNTIVYLALPLRRRETVEINAGGNQTGLTRYQAKEYEVRNNTTGSDDSATIQVGQPNFRLVLETDNLGAYTYIAIARIVECRSDKKTTLDPSFIPPCLNIQSVPPLAGFLQELQGLLHHRAEALAGRISSAGRGGSAEISDFMLLQAINRYEPLLQHLNNNNHIHPEAFYRQIIMMAGEFATFNSAHRRPEQFTEYQHDNLAATYAPVISALRRELSAVLEQTATPMPIQAHQYGIHVATIADNKLIGNAAFVLAVHADLKTEDLARRVPAQIKSGPVEQIRELVNLQLPGIALRQLPVAPRQLPYHSGFIYFELERNSELWKQMATSGGFAFHVGGEFPGLEMEFWAIKE